jgi:hypothetical protein
MNGSKPLLCYYKFYHISEARYACCLVLECYVTQASIGRDVAGLKFEVLNFRSNKRMKSIVMIK